MFKAKGKSLLVVAVILLSIIVMSVAVACDTTITPDNAQGIVVVTPAIKQEFIVGESFSSSGIKVALMNSKGAMSPLSYTDYTVDSSAFDSSVAGDYSIVITHSTNSSLTTLYRVKVRDKSADFYGEYYMIGDLDSIGVEYACPQVVLSINRTYIVYGGVSYVYTFVQDTSADIYTLTSDLGVLYYTASNLSITMNDIIMHRVSSDNIKVTLATYDASTVAVFKPAVWSDELIEALSAMGLILSGDLSGTNLVDTTKPMEAKVYYIVESVPNYVDKPFVGGYVRCDNQGNINDNGATVEYTLGENGVAYNVTITGMISYSYRAYINQDGSYTIMMGSRKLTYGETDSVLSEGNDRYTLLKDEYIVLSIYDQLGGEVMYAIIYSAPGVFNPADYNIDELYRADGSSVVGNIIVEASMALYLKGMSVDIPNYEGKYYVGDSVIEVIGGYITYNDSMYEITAESVDGDNINITSKDIATQTELALVYNISQQQITIGDTVYDLLPAFCDNSYESQDGSVQIIISSGSDSGKLIIYMMVMSEDFFGMGQCVMTRTAIGFDLTCTMEDSGEVITASYDNDADSINYNGVVLTLVE